MGNSYELLIALQKACTLLEQTTEHDVLERYKAEVAKIKETIKKTTGD